jgi:IclR family acetate operon transcriptional repressor
MANVTQTTPRPVVVVERAMAVLNVLADSRVDLGTNEIARRSGVNASSASRLLATLARSEVVRRDPGSGRYGLGLRLVELGNSALARIDLRDIARPHLLALMEATGETATLSVPGETTAMTLDFVQSPSSVRSVAEIGRPSVPHATAVGKVYLSFGGSAPDARLVACTHRTITDRNKLEKDLAGVRERGWAEAHEEREPGLNAVAVPVIDAGGTLVAILGLQGPSWRFGKEAMRAGATHLLEHAAEVWKGPGR